MYFPNVDAERAKRHMSVNALAKELHFCRRSYYKWTSQGQIPPPILSQMATFFNVDPEYLAIVAE